MLWLSMQLHRTGWFRRAPGAWGWMSKRPIPDAVMDRWFAPARLDGGVRRDLRTFALSTPSSAELAGLTQRLPSFDRPVLVVWATEDKLMPREHGRRLAALFDPDGVADQLQDSFSLRDDEQLLVKLSYRFGL